MDSPIDLSQPTYQMVKINNPEKYSEFLRLEKELYPPRAEGAKSQTALPRMSSSVVESPAFQTLGVFAPQTSMGAP